MKPKHLLIISLFALVGCAPKVEEKGYIKQGDIKEGLVIGQTSKQEVIDKLGSPSAQNSFGDETWYYIQSRQETIGFLKPEMVDQDITRIEFDKAGLISKIESYNEANAQDVKIVSRENPTEGHTLGFFEQVLGNVGRFNKAGSDTAAPGRKPSSNGY